MKKRALLTLIPLALAACGGEQPEPQGEDTDEVFTTWVSIHYYANPYDAAKPNDNVILSTDNHVLADFGFEDHGHYFYAHSAPASTFTRAIYSCTRIITGNDGSTTTFQWHTQNSTCGGGFRNPHAPVFYVSPLPTWNGKALAPLFISQTRCVGSNLGCYFDYYLGRATVGDQLLGYVL